MSHRTRPPVRFGTDGIRGRAGIHPCTPEVALALGRAAVRLAGREGARVLVARDPRSSGPVLEAAVAAGVAAQGGVARVAGVVPTSAVAAALAGDLADTGIMITASHNPDPYNGFKAFAAGGRKLHPEQDLAVESWLAEAPAEGVLGRLERVHDEVFTSYSAALGRALPDRGVLAGQRIAVDLANGAATAARDWLHEEVPADWVFLGDDGGRVNDGCGSEDVAALQRAVVEQHCAAGFAVDGDADRCRLVAGDGRVVPGDGLAYLLARGLGVDGLAVTVMSNAGLELSLPGVRVVRTPVGDRHLLAALAEHQLRLGCEESGHVVFSDALPAGDGLVTGIRALCLAVGGPGSVRAALEGFVPLPRRVLKVRVVRRPALDQLPELEGVRRDCLPLLGEGGRVFLRYSGTEPVLRILVEGEDDDVVGRVATRVAAAAEEVLG